jgi:hypothetical protein
LMPGAAFGRVAERRQLPAWSTASSGDLSDCGKQ